jgi:RHS repeat-associated protein
MGSTRYYFWDGYTVLNESQNSGMQQRLYIGRTLGHRDENVPMSTVEWSFYHHDHLGSTRVLTDASNNELGSWEYQPYGDLYASTGSGTTHLYTGHAWDATSNLYFAPYRYYNPNTARWMKRDPAGMVDGPNLYAYVGGNPVMALDATGMFKIVPHHGGGGGGLDCGIEQCFVPFGLGRGPMPYRFWHTYVKIGHKEGYWGQNEQKHWNEPATKCRKVYRKLQGTMPDGTPCRYARCEDIRNCIRNVPKSVSNTPPPWDPDDIYTAGWNDCHTKTDNTMNHCCLTSDSPLQQRAWISPITGLAFQTL